MDRISDKDRRRIAGLLAKGAPVLRFIGRSTGRVMPSGGGHPGAAASQREPKRSPLRLSLTEREEISRGLAAGESLRGSPAGGACPVDGVRGGGGRRRCGSLPGLCR
jgi:hypothetical protein